LDSKDFPNSSSKDKKHDDNSKNHDISFKKSPTYQVKPKISTEPNYGDKKISIENETNQIDLVENIQGDTYNTNKTINEDNLNISQTGAPQNKKNLR